jgi:hypothetical protein
MKHWTEPNGNFIINVPINWQYKNQELESEIEKSPFSFEAYENSESCFQVSCYPLSEKGINENLPIQKNNSNIEWIETITEEPEFTIHIYYAQVDDLLCMAKYIYSTNQRKVKNQELETIKAILNTFIVIPVGQRIIAKNLSKYDNFQSSLIASYDLLKNAINSESFIEIVVVFANQIDAFLRLSIILETQLENKTNEIEVKYLFQENNEKGITERKIYNLAFDNKIVDENTYNELNHLYDFRNRIIHRYIISHIKTRDLVIAAYEYSKLNEKIRLILREKEASQVGKGFGIYGNGFNHSETFNEEEIKRAYSMANDKHLYEKYKRLI